MAEADGDDRGPLELSAVDKRRASCEKVDEALLRDQRTRMTKRPPSAATPVLHSSGSGQRPLMCSFASRHSSPSSSHSRRAASVAPRPIDRLNFALSNMWRRTANPDPARGTRECPLRGLFHEGRTAQFFSSSRLTARIAERRHESEPITARGTANNCIVFGGLGHVSIPAPLSRNSPTTICPLS
jgi:hypothetical protein